MSRPCAPPATELRDRVAVTTLRVRYGETDRMGFVYHARYLDWCDVGRTELIRRLGTSYAELERDGLLLAVSEAQLRYLLAARYDDVVEIRSRLERVQSRSVTFAYEIVRAEPAPRARLATATVKLVALNAEGTPRTLPPEFRRRLDAVVAPSPLV